MKHRSLLITLTAAFLSAALSFSGIPGNVRSADAAEELPARFDLREEAPELLTPVKNQIGGSCWAYAAIGCIESNLIRNGYADNSIDLSESHLIWFTTGQDAPTDPEDLRYGTGKNLGKDAYDSGSNEFHTFASLASWQGVVPEGDVPDATDKPVMDESLRYLSVAHMRNGIRYPDSPKIIKSKIMEKGPVGAAFVSRSDVLSEQNGFFYTKDAAGGKEIGGGWHAIIIVGWDDDFPKENFRFTPPGDGAWIIKNSFGTGYGEEGYIYLSYYEPTLTKFIQFDMEPVTNYGAVHNYNCSDMSYAYTEEGSAFSAASVFEAKEDETIAAVGFFTYELYQTYDVSVYKLSQGYKDPCDGELVTQLKGTMPYEGLHTLDLPESYEAKKGTYYSVVVKNPVTKGRRIFTDSDCSRPGISYYRTYRIETENPWRDCYDAHKGDHPIYVYTAYKGEEKDPFIGGRVKGDVNRDGAFDVSDAVLLQKWLLNMPDAKLGDWKAADICDDNRLDVFDFCMMRRMLTAE